MKAHPLVIMFPELRQAEYQLRIFDPVNGQPVALITDWIALNYVKQVNNFHTLQLVLNADDPNVDLFILDCLVEVWRRPDGQEWYRELVTMFRTDQYDLYENGHETFTVYCRGLNDLLHRRHILYPSTTAQTLKTGPADDVMKAFVRENCTADGHIPARKSFTTYDCTLYGLTVVPDISAAPTWTGARAWLNLLDGLLDIALAPSLVDFEIIRTGYTGFNFQFTTYYPQRGADRTTSVTFAPELGNMKNIKFTRSRTEEANVIFVLGQGEGTARTVLGRAAAATVLNASRWNAIETTTDARSQDSVEAYMTQADELLDKLKVQSQIEFEVIQTPSRQYGIDYNVGDITLSRFRNFTAVKKISAANVSMSKGVEAISFDFTDPNAAGADE